MYSFLNLLPLSLFPPSPLLNKMNFHTHTHTHTYTCTLSFLFPPSSSLQVNFHRQVHNKQRNRQRDREREMCACDTHYTKSGHMYITCNTPVPNIINDQKHDKCLYTGTPNKGVRTCTRTRTCVPLIITVWAGRLTPQARVAVDISTCMWPSANRSSTRVLSILFIPALWIAKPYGSKSFKSKFYSNKK